MTSLMLEEDKRLSKIVNNQTIKEIRHVDNDLCVKILFEDGTYLIIDTMKIDFKCERPYMPTLIYYDTNDYPV